MTPSDSWYKNAIFYALDIKTFQDSNGDGVGDFQGAIQRLDYLKALGINCIWLLPFHRSPFRDNGYDVEDHFSVSPQLGSLEDFEEFVHKAGELGIRVIIDLVAEHTSDQHPWFKASRRSPKSRFRDYYIWRETPPFEVQDKNVFPDEEKGIWTFDQLAQAYYCHHFYTFQPSLNFHNEEVLDEAIKTMDFWLSFGISGFRVDAVPFMVGNSSAENGGVRTDFLRRMRALLEARVPDGVLLGESDLTVYEMDQHIGNGDQLNMLLNFILSRYLFLALAKGEKESLEYYLHLTRDVGHLGHFCNFLRNLDELNFDRLQDGDRELAFQSYDPEGMAFIFQRGLRRRAAPLLGGNQSKLRLAFSLLFSMPGSPLITYGDEIGMGDNLALEGRTALRTPMQWDDGPQGGFSTANRTFVPVIQEGDYGFQKINVKSQDDDPDSMLNWMRNLIRVRKMCPEMGADMMVYLPNDRPEVLTIHSQLRGGHVLTFHNLSGRKVTSNLKLSSSWHGDFQALFGDAPFRLNHHSLEVELQPYGLLWLREHFKE